MMPIPTSPAAVGETTAAAAFEDLGRKVRPAVEAALGRVLDESVERARAHGTGVGETFDALRALTLRGGKRWRAVLVAAAYEGCGGKGGATAVVMAGAAIELLQAYLLIHDDWMDGDATRRGGPSVHAALAEHLGSEHLGASAAILAGDHASALAQEALLAVPVPASCLVDAARELARLQSEVTLGQTLDVLNAGDLDAVYDLKTTSYTVRGPLLIGASLAGASVATRSALEQYARPLGFAFQMRDDILGTLGDPKATGKPIGGDVRQGKRTALVAEMENDTFGTRLLARVLGVSDAPDDEVLALTRHMVDSGARARVEARVRALLDEAVRAADSPAVPIPLRRILLGAAEALGNRER